MGFQIVGKMIERTMSWSPGTSMVPLANELGEGRLEGSTSKEVHEMNLSGKEISHSSLAVVAMPDKEVKENETLVVNPIAVIEEHEVPQSVPSDWVFERVKSFCHAVGLSCEGFKDQMLALFSAIEASRHQNGLVSVPDVCFRTTNKGNR